MRFPCTLALALLPALAACAVDTPPEQAASAAPAPELMKWPALLTRERPRPSSTIRYGDDQMQVVERWTPIGPNLMRYEATITDPQTYTRPWKMSMNLYKRQGEDARLQQFKCVEFVEELMYGHLRKTPLK